MLSYQRRTTRKPGEEGKKAVTDKDMQRLRIVRRAALEFKDGMYGILLLPLLYPLASVHSIGFTPTHPQSLTPTNQ